MGNNDPVVRRADSQQLARQWTILRLLADSGRSFTVKALSDQLGVSKSTIQRDLATLETQFALIEEQVGKQKRTYRIDQKIRALETLTFGITELLALHAAQHSLVSMAGTPLQEDLQSVITKIRGFLSPRHNGGLDAIARVFQVHPRGYVDYANHGEVIDTLSDAIARHRLCDISYHAPWKGTTREHRIKPLRLLWHRSALYLFANIEGMDEITTFAVHRIENIETSTETFKPSRADLADHARRAFGIFVSEDEEDVEILFDKDIAWRIEERVFHPDETKERLPDGSLRYRVRTSAQWEIIPWVLSYGALAELTSPSLWRRSIQETAETMSKTYTESDPGLERLP